MFSKDVLAWEWDISYYCIYHSQLGSSMAHLSLAGLHLYGAGATEDIKKAIQNMYRERNGFYGGVRKDKHVIKALNHWRVSAIAGNTKSRHNLGYFEIKESNMIQAMKHWMNFSI